uniref:Uncharacterized protein n=1 Tax=Laticauda laticaudata TaxID=8630 RepID=A0A8C5WRL2_LATLA
FQILCTCAPRKRGAGRCYLSSVELPQARREELYAKVPPLRLHQPRPRLRLHPLGEKLRPQFLHEGTKGIHLPPPQMK